MSRPGLRKVGVDPFDEGALAFDVGLPRWACPWLDHPDFRPRWFGGYDAAKRTRVIRKRIRARAQKGTG
jgi:hypothetical protein